MDSRQTFLHIAPAWPFYLLAALALAGFAYGIWRHLAKWLTSTPDRKLDRPGPGLASAAIDGLLGRAVFRHDFLAGLIHFGLAWGFIILFAGTLGLMVHEYGLPWLTGRAYAVYSLILEIAGLALVLAAAAAIIRRVIGRPARLERGWLDFALPGLILIVGLSGFGVEAVRLAALHPEVETYSFGGRWLAGLVSAHPDLYRTMWWTHALSALGLIAVIPYTKLSHVLAAPAQLYHHAQPVRSLTAEEFLIADRSAVIAASACTRCGRCVELCPAVAAGEDFTPRDYLAGLRSGDGLAAAAMWHCSTCRACEEHCPLSISSPGLLTRERGKLVEEGVELPPEGIEALESIHKHKNPWGVPKRKKAAWVRKAKAPVLARLKRPVEILYFTGCTAPVDTRAVGSVNALAKIFHAVEEDWAVLADKEPCCGDAARVWGELGLYEECYAETVEAVTGQAKRIVTTSPHCSHTMTNLYPGLAQALDGETPDAAISHYSVFLAGLIESGRLKPGPAAMNRVTYHDPCYLGRWAGEFEAPRRVLAAVPGLELREMPRNRAGSLCCGGGGGRLFQDFEAPDSPAAIRLREAAATGAQALVTACPICLIMFTDALKTTGLEGEIEVIDLAELVAGSLADEREGND